ncbi:hypothetical protein Cgig2_012688 [Carnegiea gigantea]|uniref:Uncharacterized protein n=1 Tax=Carnegiea gigantea TaxID=171969 RepID=A0A9Q1QAM1_9CARY|nr:hypothetical protein Cgig2_012688 [Carnegiea gigantea]
MCMALIQGQVATLEIAPAPGSAPLRQEFQIDVKEKKNCRRRSSFKILSVTCFRNKRNREPKRSIEEQGKTRFPHLTLDLKSLFALRSTQALVKKMYSNFTYKQPPNGCLTRLLSPIQRKTYSNELATLGAVLRELARMSYLKRNLRLFVSAILEECEGLALNSFCSLDIVDRGRKVLLILKVLKKINRSVFLKQIDHVRVAARVLASERG